MGKTQRGNLETQTGILPPAVNWASPLPQNGTAGPGLHKMSWLSACFPDSACSFFLDAKIHAIRSGGILSFHTTQRNRNLFSPLSLQPVGQILFVSCKRHSPKDMPGAMNGGIGRLITEG